MIYACISVLIVSTFMIGSSTAAQQYFPTDGTETRYNISWQTRYLTTSISTDKFNVYTTAVVNQTLALSVWMDENMAPNKTGYMSIVNDTTIDLVISYTNYNSTHLARKTAFALKDRTIRYGEFGVFYFRNQTTSSRSQYPVIQTVIYVQKSGFITTFNTVGVLDYFNVDTGIGQAIYPGQYITNIGTTIVSLWTYSGGSGTANRTYIADGSSGRVLSTTHCTRDLNKLSIGFQYLSISSTLVTTTNTVPPETPLLPEYAYWIICAGLGVLCVFLGTMLAKAKRT